MSKVKTVTIYLQSRTGTGESISVPIRDLRGIFQFPEEVAKDRLWSYFEPMRAADVFEIHDVEHLRRIVNWVEPSEDPRIPPRGLPVTEQVKWHKLGDRVNKLDPEKNGNFTIKFEHAQMIMDRVKNPMFTTGFNLPMLDFLKELSRKSGINFEETEPDDEFEFSFEPDADEIDEDEQTVVNADTIEESFADNPDGRELIEVEKG